ncbi:LysR family transcriptional regulator [Variovorax paradoxus]|nr:LysR family transcriptional regulator [Variovorax paradoxus]MBT2304522.1 LysR family transcriptional regulator [Variovorax paradoxus]
MRPGDLNLLLHFDALMNQRGVSRAAEEVEISQPAMSAALSRLRRLFNDPILVREGGVWRPTPKAQDLHTAFRPMLDLWRHVSVARVEFDPASSRRAMTVFATDYVQFTVLSRVIGRLTQAAPGMELRVLAARPQLGLEMLDSNQVELIAGYYPEPAANLRTRFLFEEKVVCLVRGGHPCLQRRWGLDTYLAYGHVNLAAHTRYFSERIDRALEGQNRSRRIALTLSSYLACPFAVGNSDLIATVPLSVAKALGKQAGTVTLDAPIALPMLTVSLYWHERHHRDPAHAWVRQFIARMF